MSLEVTEVSVNKVALTPNIVGFAKITFNKCFVVDGIKIINGSNGLFVGMPSRKNKDEKYQDVCYPVTKETRKMIQDMILDAYNNEGGASSSSSGSSKKEENLFNN